jgi:hypothetical protein
MQSSTAKPAFDDLSPDLQWHICQRQERVELVVQMGAIAAIGLLALPMISPALNKQMDISLHEGREIKIWGVTIYSVPPALEAIGVLPPEALQAVEVGDAIAGYEVNSGYGDRTHPIYGDVRFHNGVDLPTDEGVPIYAPGAKSSRVKVDCKNQPGAGLHAEISSPDIPGLKFQAMHLSDCATGLHPGGEVIARTGNTGDSTGPHLHWRNWTQQPMSTKSLKRGICNGS